jgi:hypothetical protein
MSIVALIIVLIVIGVGLYLINSVIPMDGKIKTILNVVVVLATLIWVLSVFGLLDGLGTIGPRTPVVHPRC